MYAENHVNNQEGEFYYVILYAFHRGRKKAGKEYRPCLILMTSGRNNETLWFRIRMEIWQWESYHLIFWLGVILRKVHSSVKEMVY